MLETHLTIKLSLWLSKPLVDKVFVKGPVRFFEEAIFYIATSLFITISYIKWYFLSTCLPFRGFLGSLDQGWKFPFFWRKFRRNFGFRWPEIRKRGAKCRREKFRQISVKIGEKITETWLQAKNRWNFGLYRRFFGKFPDISYQSNPCTGYKIYPIFIFLKKKI